LDDGFGVRQAVEIHADGRTAPAGLRTRGEPQIFHRFGSFGEVFFQERTIGVGLELLQLTLAGLARQISAQELAQCFEFEYVGAGVQKGRASPISSPFAEAFFNDGEGTLR
jgi:hypothetical protein